MRYRPIALLTIVAACVFAACDHGTTHGTIARGNEQAALGEPFWLAAGATTVIEGTGWDLTFDRVVSDDRCPVGSICVTWLLGVRVSLTAKLDGRSPETVQVSTITGPTSFAAGNLQAQLLDVEPERYPNQEIPADQYRIQLVVERP